MNKADKIVIGTKLFFAIAVLSAAILLHYDIHYRQTTTSWFGSPSTVRRFWIVSDGQTNGTDAVITVHTGIQMGFRSDGIVVWRTNAEPRAVSTVIHFGTSISSNSAAEEPTGLQL